MLLVVPLAEAGGFGHRDRAEVLVHLGEADGLDRSRARCALVPQGGELGRLGPLGILALDAVQFGKRLAIVLEGLVPVAVHGLVLGQLDEVVGLLQKPVQTRGAVGVGLVVRLEPKPVPSVRGGRSRQAEGYEQMLDHLCSLFSPSVLE